MKNAAQKIKSSTQKFLEIEGIKDNIVMLSGAQACVIIQITATNFALLSKEEQDARMFAYASLLNSLSFPIEILVRSKKIQITPYLKLLNDEAQKTPNPKLKSLILQYKTFIETLVKETSILDKSFYIIVPYSSLETGLKNAGTSIKGGATTNPQEFFLQAKNALHAKTDGLISQLDRLALRSKILGKEDLTKVFYDIYNQENTAIEGDTQEFMKSFFVEEKKDTQVPEAGK